MNGTEIEFDTLWDDFDELNMVSCLVRLNFGAVSRKILYFMFLLRFLFFSDQIGMKHWLGMDEVKIFGSFFFIVRLVKSRLGLHEGM